MESVDKEWNQFLSFHNNSLGTCNDNIFATKTNNSLRNHGNGQDDNKDKYNYIFENSIPSTGGHSHPQNIKSNKPESICFDEKHPSPSTDTSKLLGDETATTSATAECPQCDELYISTKTKVLYFNQPIDIHSVFWKIPVIEYWKPTEGVIKKQIKIVSKSKEEFDDYCKKLSGVHYYKEHIIKQIDNPTARVLKYKDERKITIGISKKDIINTRGKIKNAFYNCFVVIIRFKHLGFFREIHVKVFNTGKMEIPGVFDAEQLEIVKQKLVVIVGKHIVQSHPTAEGGDKEPNGNNDNDYVSALQNLTIIESVNDDNVLINSNFNCGFNINREKLHHIFTKKYGIETSYDPCSYPGVKCKYYFNNEMEFDETKQFGQIINSDRMMKMSELGDNKKYTEVSFMVFRTGSCLIVGNCSEKILRFIFMFLKNILREEYNEIYVSNNNTENKEKKIKRYKKTISVSS